MTCTQTQNMISAYMDKELSGVDMMIISQHLRQCPDCSAEYQQLLNIKRMMAALQGPAPSPAFEQRLVDSVMASQQNAPAKRRINWVNWFRSPLVVRPVMALSSICVVLSGYGLTHRSSYVSAALNFTPTPEVSRQFNLSKLQNEADEIKQRWNGLAQAHQKWELIDQNHRLRSVSTEANIQPVSFVSYSE